MILIRGGVLDCKDMNESVPSVVGARSGQPSTATAVASVVAGAKPTIKPVQNSVAASIGRNNNKTGVSLINSKSQSPSEDKTIRYGVLPCETDHMYANYTDGGKYRELANEVAHLKALVLFHLDLIQQQSESNAAKDKQLSVLKQENEMVSGILLLDVRNVVIIYRFLFPVKAKTGPHGEESPAAEFKAET